MTIVGHGVDLVEVARIERLIERHGQRLLDRCFTPDEIAYARRAAKRPSERFASRFAAKEAVLKAIGTGWTNGIGWTDVEVRVNSAGRPEAVLSGRAGEIARAKGIDAWHLSLTHSGGFAQASAIAERTGGARDA